MHLDNPQDTLSGYPIHQPSLENNDGPSSASLDDPPHSRLSHMFPPMPQFNTLEVSDLLVHYDPLAIHDLLIMV